MRKILNRHKVFWFLVKIFFVIFFIFLFIESGLWLAKYTFLLLQEQRNEATLLKRGAYRILCLGESTTAVGGTNSYPSQLENILNQRNVPMRFSVINRGIPATNSTAIVNALEDNLVRYKPQMVIVMMGENDLLMGWKDDYLSPIKKTVFFKQFKTYKIARTIWLYIRGEAGELRRYPQTYEGLEDSHKKTIETDPKNQKAYIFLGRCYMDEGKHRKAEACFKKAIELNPGESEPYIDLGRCYINQSKYDQAEAMFSKALEINPKDMDGYIDLAWCYELQVKHSQAEGLFRKMTGLSKSAKTYGKMGVYYQEQGRYDLADRYFKIAAQLRLKSQNSITRENYQRLKRLVVRKGIRLVCIQYPMRSARPLKGMLKPYGKKVMVVDNEKIFKEALAKRKYSEYFTDDFGGEFGHGTALGNLILAENIADCILNWLAFDNYGDQV